MTDQLRVGIVGAQRGTSLIPGFRAQGAEVTSLCARNEDFLNSQADRFGVADHQLSSAARIRDRCRRCGYANAPSRTAHAAGAQSGQARN